MCVFVSGWNDKVEQCCLFHRFLDVEIEKSPRFLYYLYDFNIQWYSISRYLYSSSNIPTFTIQRLNSNWVEKKISPSSFQDRNLSRAQLRTKLIRMVRFLAVKTRGISHKSSMAKEICQGTNVEVSFINWTSRGSWRVFHN